MQINEFLKKLTGLYRDSNEIKVEALTEWLQERRLSDFQIGLLYDEIVNNYKYKTFPTLGEINEFWQNLNNTKRTTEELSPIEKQRKLSEDWSVHKLTSKLYDIRVKLNTYGTKSKLKPHEVDLMHQWSTLHSEHGICKDLEVKGDRRKEHLEYVKRCIIKGEQPESIMNIVGDEKRKQQNIKEVEKASNRYAERFL